MENEHRHDIPRPEPLPEGATDMEIVLFLAGHIDNPCEVGTAPGVVENIRDFYIREAQKVMPNFTNPGAKRTLELKIKEYENSQ